VFPLRFAAEALGHDSKAVHSAYASKAEVTVPSLDKWEREMKDKVIELNSSAAYSPAQPGSRTSAAAG
jgi:hypothetical protein